VLTEAMTAADTDLARLGEAMKSIGPIARSAGLEFEEVVAAVRLLSNVGIRGKTAGTTMRTALLTLDPLQNTPRERAWRVRTVALNTEVGVHLGRARHQRCAPSP